MGPYGSVWGDIKTRRSPMALDHFWTPLDSKMAIRIAIREFPRGSRIAHAMMGLSALFVRGNAHAAGSLFITA